MPRSSHKKIRHETEEKKPNGKEVGKIKPCWDFPTLDGEEEALSILRNNDSIKDWAFRLRVSTEYIRQMVKGMKSIPKKYFNEIAKRRLEISWQGKHEEEWSLRILGMGFGHNVDPGRF